MLTNITFPITTYENRHNINSIAGWARL